MPEIIVPISTILASISGLILGLAGAGGGLLMLPLFTDIYGFTFDKAVGFILCFTAALSFVSLVSEQGKINYRIGFEYFALSAVGAVLGSQLSGLISELQKDYIYFFVIVLVTASVFKNRESKKAPPNSSFYLIAILTGILTSIIGIGGAFLIVPSLIALKSLDGKSAISTSFLIIFLNSIVSIFSNLFFAGVNYEYIVSKEAAVLFSVIFFGFSIGKMTYKRLSSSAAERIFKSLLVLLLFVATYKLF